MKKLLLALLVTVSLANAEVLHFVNNTNHVIQYTVDSNKCYNYNISTQTQVVQPYSKADLFTSLRTDCGLDNEHYWLQTRVIDLSNNNAYLGDTHADVHAAPGEQGSPETGDSVQAAFDYAPPNPSNMVYVVNTSTSSRSDGTFNFYYNFEQ